MSFIAYSYSLDNFEELEELDEFEELDLSLMVLLDELFPLVLLEFSF